MLIGGLWMATPALAEDVGIPVTVMVIDAETQEAVRTAVVRHPAEQDRHRVNTETGAWSGSVLYLPNGDELVFEKGMELQFEVSAPGYQNTAVTYTVRKRKNVFEVPLQKMEVDLSEEDPEDIVIQFGRDKPID
jgi:hypothetical protein